MKKGSGCSWQGTGKKGTEDSFQGAEKRQDANSYLTFEDLEVWKRASRLSANIYKELASLKDFGFKDQITRSGLSIPSNIAEGIERESNKECINFLQYAKGSCGELRTQIYIGLDIGYISDEIGKQWIKETRELSAMLVGLMRSKRNNGSKKAGKKGAGGSFQGTS
ncbi:MAG: four helix bundle protein [Candidatus Brocadia sp.]|uniref:Ribosomal protein n=1 Tax=Candidatus Brocadia fulgida TaxID=380242 RepID=A0A0M2UT08_9BACT|nr:MAG: ribosomal protein [Candidatus Brocadia fulgida]UJS21750.1 MAG: four helix bundle protein [Candidatus Brocadia sp.]